MNKDDSPAPADSGEEKSAPENVPASPPDPVNSKPHPRVDASAPDAFAVGVRVLRIAPAWLLAVTVACSALILLLGWVNDGGAANAVERPPALNDARAARTALAADVPAKVASAPAPEAAPPAPVPTGTPAPAPAAPPQAAEKVRAEAPAPPNDAAAKFTVQVGSFNSQSEANERVSGLRAAGFESRAVAAELPGRGTWYRVQVGLFADREGAAKAAATLREKDAAAAAIVVPVQN